MKTELSLNENYIKRFITASLAALIFVAFFSRMVMADTGPKRSIEIKIINPPAEPYYVALVMPTEHVANINDTNRYDHIPEDHDWVREIFYEYNEDGFRLFTYAGGTNSIKYSGEHIDFYKGENRLRLGYVPLDEDKVLCDCSLYDGADDYRLFYRGSELEAIERDKLYFPDLSHA